MRLPHLLLFLLAMTACQSEKLHKISDEEFIRRIVNDSMPDPESVEIRTAAGTEISLDSLKILERTGEYFEDFYANEAGEIVRVVIREMTEADEDLIDRISNIMMAKNAREVKPVEIDCADKVNILQQLYERDQGMRTNGGQIDPDIDHQNLEIVVSFLEQCGMPTLEEVNEEQMAGIWAVLQHAPPPYQSKYIPLLEKAAQNGDIEMHIIALMKDRALMHEGKPQVYGTQIRNGKLYHLLEPEYVDQRREAVGLGPLADYVSRFGLEFTVPQKRK